MQISYAAAGRAEKIEEKSWRKKVEKWQLWIFIRTVSKMIVFVWLLTMVQPTISKKETSSNSKKLCVSLLSCRMGIHTSITSLFEVICARKHLDMDEYRLIYKGDVIDLDDLDITPKSLNMKEIKEDEEGEEDETIYLESIYSESSEEEESEEDEENDQERKGVCIRLTVSDGTIDYR